MSGKRLNTLLLSFCDPRHAELSPRIRSGGCWFFTVNLLDRRGTFLIDEIEMLREATRWTRNRYPFHIDALVVLPDHLHAVWTLPVDDADFPYADA